MPTKISLSPVRVYGTRETAFLKGKPIGDFRPAWMPNTGPEEEEEVPLYASASLRREVSIEERFGDALLWAFDHWYLFAGGALLLCAMRGR